MLSINESSTNEITEEIPSGATLIGASIEYPNPITGI